MCMCWPDAAIYLFDYGGRGRFQSSPACLTVPKESLGPSLVLLCSSFADHDASLVESDIIKSIRTFFAAAVRIVFIATTSILLCLLQVAPGTSRPILSKPY
jgi:hypothetical protein